MGSLEKISAMYHSAMASRIPKCFLIQNLQKKSKQRRDITFDYLGELNRFGKRVSDEIRQINELFPEYTPHDDKYHISRLFHVADKVLGQPLISELNATELFVLACSVFGHDWGMAVNETERQAIIHGTAKSSDEFSLLPNEAEMFQQFLKKHSSALKGANNEIPIELWREYVRQTHAPRSGQRVKRYFESLGSGLGEAIARVCEGHWVDFEVLHDYRLYPQDFSVLSESVNLRALAVYVRLIDLLDIADDRTPFAIWKFVDPQDPTSKMEWAKHRALSPITCPPYQAGRIIQIDGSTDDYEVYAALEDLRIWIQGQFKGCMDTLHRLNDPKHRLDIYHVDWRVAARGFEPISVRFEFERSTVFEILSSHVYQGDSYVFLRELLQNSIDAIRVRREILERRGAGAENVGVIQVNVKHGTNGDCEVTWIDDGIGMDEYIVQNYLAVAGRSYYRSTDFEREGLNFDPISRFGIGILSCFMVADRIDIETCRDPYISREAKLLHIEIPSIQRQFRVSSRSSEGAQIGTTVKVHVKGEKLGKDERKDDEQLFDVTTYLSTIAGFVEFPIVITEHGNTTIILHPNQNAEAAKKRFANKYSNAQVHQLSLSYPWSKVIYPDHLDVAKELCEEVRWDVGNDANVPDFEGAMVYLEPTIQVSLARSPDHNYPSFGSLAKSLENEFRFAGQDDLQYEISDRERNFLSSSSHTNSFLAVFKDGILVPKSWFPSFDVLYSSSSALQKFSYPRFIVNIKSSKLAELSISRFDFQTQNAWDNPLKQAFDQYQRKHVISPLETRDLNQRLVGLAESTIFHWVKEDDVRRLFANDKFPVIILDSNGSPSIVEWAELSDDTLFTCPSDLRKYFSVEKEGGWLKFSSELEGNWNGDICVIRAVGDWRFREPLLNQAINISASKLNDWFVSERIRFLQSPQNCDFPLFQHIYQKKDTETKPVTGTEYIEQLLDSKAIITSSQLKYASKVIEAYMMKVHHGYSTTFPPITVFGQPFTEKFSYGVEVWNESHKITQAFIRSVLRQCLAFMHKEIDDLRYEELKHLISRVIDRRFFLGETDDHTPLSGLQNRFDKYWTRVKSIGIFSDSSLHLIPQYDDFVPGTVTLRDGKEFLVNLDLALPKRITKPFGKVLG